MKQSFLAGFFYFLIVGAAGIALGVLREMFVTPQFGKTFAVILEVPLMLMLAWYSCRMLLRLVGVSHHMALRLLMGVTGFVLLLAMEQALAMALAMAIGSTSQKLAFTQWPIADYIGLAGQVAFGLFPVFVRTGTEPVKPPAYAVMRDIEPVPQRDRRPRDQAHLT